MIRHVCDAISGGDFAMRCCVIGAHREAIATEIPEQFELIDNTDWALGLSQSIRAGVRHVSDHREIDAIFIFLADQPFIQANDMNRMIALYLEHPERCVATSYDAQPGVPAIFPRKYFPSLLNLSGDKGAKPFLDQLGSEIILYRHQGIADVDTWSDYQDYSDSQ